MENKYHSQYKEIWYRYYPPKYTDVGGSWSLSDRQDNMGYRSIHTERRRIDQIFELFFKEYEDFRKRNPWYNPEMLSEDIIKKLKENGE